MNSTRLKFHPVHPTELGRHWSGQRKPIYRMSWHRLETWPWIITPPIAAFLVPRQCTVNLLGFTPHDKCDLESTQDYNTAGAPFSITWLVLMWLTWVSKHKIAKQDELAGLKAVSRIHHVNRTRHENNLTTIQHLFMLKTLSKLRKEKTSSTL